MPTLHTLLLCCCPGCSVTGTAVMCCFCHCSVPPQLKCHTPHHSVNVKQKQFITDTIFSNQMHFLQASLCKSITCNCVSKSTEITLQWHYSTSRIYSAHKESTYTCAVVIGSLTSNTGDLGLLPDTHCSLYL